MKKTFTLLCACALMAAACNKSHVLDSLPTDDHGCIEKAITDRNSPGLAPADMKSADSLMKVNHVDHSRIRYYRYQADTFRTFSNVLTLNQVIRADQYVNGLRIFNAERHFVFTNGILTYTAGTLITTGNPLGKPTLTSVQLRSLFTRDILKPDSLNLHPFTDSCYRAEYGYFNMGGDYAAPKLVKAWLVSLRSYDRMGNILAGYYQDSDGKLLGFSGGPIN